jgi:hypothetical protein
VIRVILKDECEFRIWSVEVGRGCMEVGGVCAEVGGMCGSLKLRVWDVEIDDGDGKMEDFFLIIVVGGSVVEVGYAKTPK